ncbi:zinc fingers and homeoboxes protein 3 [Electrophorus electricus]|uniref:Homeobox domain-containing protein n=1 Tax=Electrophorus electricus TaxID=8005 RepID=A0AAY5EGP2_ELEEL|nr:zinc fingers and homeoboxes protein 3 [Electrophorus electricus]XP_026884065.2 zinc fingers and homeoboxes protein 3 [Electrophorus electricus]
MASKRKSTVPCMIPVKTLHLHEDVEQGCDSPSSRDCSFSKDEGVGKGFHGLGESSGQDTGDVNKDTGTYVCRPCRFETQDLNLFLDHVYSGHPEFRSDPSFFCADCGVSAAKFEGLALHNARVHPSTLTTTLQLKKKDRKVTVEQNLVVGPGESTSAKDSEISITKTPIMKMLKGKSEPKRIVVSHAATDEAAKQAESIDSPPVTVTHVPTIVHNGAASKVSLPSAIQIVNGSGALPMLKTAITQVVSVVQNRSLNQQSSSLTLSSSSSGSKNLPKVMIPLSSIPTYNASMDSSSFLKTSFSKFPYPTKAELCYLTVVTKYPEEQIKIWFTAQRLKQGISWSPEEIEDARRKMFNTIIQTAPPAGAQQRQPHHGTAQQTIAVLPASLGTPGIPHILQGSLVGQGGVIVTQPMMANGIQVGSTPVALALTPKPQAAAKPPMQAKPAAALMADKGLGVVVGAVGSSNSANFAVSNGASSSSTSSVISSVSTPASVISVSGNSNSKVSVPSNNNNIIKAVNGNKNSTNLKSNISKCSTDGGTDAKGTGDDTKRGGNASPGGTVITSPAGALATIGCIPSKADSPSPASANSRTLPTTSFLDPSFYKAKKSQEQLSALKESFLVSQFPNQEEVDRLTSLTGLTVREVRKWFSDRRYHFRNLKGARSSTGGQTTGSSAGSCAFSSAPAAELPDSAVISERPRTPQQMPLSPPRQQQQQTTPPTPTRRPPRPPSPDFTAIRYKEREPHQVRALEASFGQNPDPSGEEVDRLRAETKMTRREIHGWFAERRKRVAAEKKKEELERAEREEEEQLDEEEGASENGRKDAFKETAEGSRGDEESSSSETQQQLKDEKHKDDVSGTEPKVNPIKINLKMLKVTESNGKGEGPQTTPETPKVPPPLLSQAPYRGKKTPEQLHLLKQAFARTHWPSSALYNELIARTGLPRPEVVRWFGDCRYVLKNGQLKWLESYQSMVDEEDFANADVAPLREHLEAHGKLAEEQVEELATASGLGEELVRRWFARRAKGPPPTGSRKPDETEATETKAVSSVAKGKASQKSAQQEDTDVKANQSNVAAGDQTAEKTAAHAATSEKQGRD